MNTPGADLLRPRQATFTAVHQPATPTQENP
jgi:hypothetical protein